MGVERPVNDDFAQRLIIPNLHPNVSVHGSNNWATAETGELYGGSSIWWSWTAPASGAVTFDTCGSFQGAYLKIFTGTAITNLGFFGSALSSPCASLTFDATAGTTYQVAVDGSIQGAISLNVAGPESPSVSLTVSSASANGRFTLQTLGVPGQSSVLEGSLNLSEWTPLATNDYTGALLEFQDTSARTLPRRFYRVRQQ